MKTYKKYLTEAKTVNDSNIARQLSKRFGVKVRKLDVKKKVVFHLAEGIDEGDFANFDLIDGINDFLEKTYDGIVKHDFNKFTVEQL